MTLEFREENYALWWAFLQKCRAVLGPDAAVDVHAHPQEPEPDPEMRPYRTTVEHGEVWPGMDAYLHEARRAYVMKALEEVGVHTTGPYRGKYRLTAAATLIGMHPTQVSAMMNKYDIAHPIERADE